jgi:hypothetical protein
MRAVIVLALALATATSAFAGKIFGDISIDGKPVAAGIKVKVTKPGAAVTADTTATDKFGSYKLTVKEEGKSTLVVYYEKSALEIPVFSS